MTNLGNEKSQNRVHRNIVYIVSREENWGPNQLNVNHLGAGTIKILLFHIVPGPYFPAFYRSICSRIPVFVVQTKGMDCIAGVYDKLYRRRGLASSEPDHSERFRNRSVLGTQSN